MTRLNLIKPNTGKSLGAAAPKDPNVVIIAVDDIATWPNRDNKNVNIVGSYAMKPGAKMHTFYCTPSKIKVSMEPTGEEDSISFKQKFEAETPGNELTTAEFVQNWTGVNVIIIYGSCSDPYRKVMGTKCAPLQLKPSLIDDNTGRHHTLMFEQFANTGYLPGHYTGALIFEDPVLITTAADGLELSDSSIFKLPVGSGTTIAITDHNANHGDIITLIANAAPSGTANDKIVQTSTIAALNPILVKEDWEAADGSVIHLQAFEYFPSKFIFLEISRN